MLNWAMLHWQWLVPGYLLCCLLAYGLLKKSTELMFNDLVGLKYGIWDEIFHLGISLFGPLSLIAALLPCYLCKPKNSRLKLRFRMPEELLGVNKE